MKCWCGHEPADHRDFPDGNTSCYYLSCMCLKFHPSEKELAREKVQHHYPDCEPGCTKAGA